MLVAGHGNPLLAEAAGAQAREGGPRWNHHCPAAASEHNPAVWKWTREAIAWWLYLKVFDGHPQVITEHPKKIVLRLSRCAVFPPFPIPWFEISWHALLLSVD